MSAIECALIGTVNKPPDFRVAKTGQPFVRLNVRCGDAEPQWVNVIVFGDCVEELAGLQKGDRIYCEGILRLGGWTGHDGLKHACLDVTSWRCSLVRIGRYNDHPEQQPKQGRSRRAAAQQAKRERKLVRVNDAPDDDLDF
jgi:single-stranded DNA-binding protein